jgi:uncharacterized protein YdeI (YjbR/CyaY-like superfamily)
VGSHVAAGRDRPEKIVAFATADAWQAWLERNHASVPAVWIKMARKATGIRSVTHDEAVDRALCYGWIDGQRKPFDGQYFIQRFTPRRPQSRWSQVNRERAEALIQRGVMRSAGLAEINRAKADGRWAAAYPPQRASAVPEDLQRALDGNRKAAAFFASLDRLNRYAIVYRVHQAVRPEARARRIQMYVNMLASHQKIHP